MPDIAQPAAPASLAAVPQPDGERAAQIARLIDAHRQRPGALLPMLHALQDAFSHVPDEAVPLLARALNLSRAEVHGVITFYHHFRQQPPAGQVVQLCRAEACQAVGAEALATHAQRVLGCAFHQPSADGAFTLEPVYCLGLCASGPAMMLGEQLHGRVDAARFDALLDAARTAQAGEGGA
ncbi:formate dehydrogenase subunit gamma [Cupriavidus sp. USMAA2-4]|uniref:Formate dehydrogenase subunit gamma n=1 Tax=Cupriavidus malaysiensis TaxID=367825 RepID=A0ABM6F8M4_9BURK|nr:MULTISPECIES: formate dehydrogenase subunit gamma [Cupriavidus]AOY94035.1 formate dehydrogenase subunit gamma [Cupriavidus sp. USMAA2-4]AOZ01147.1 formate dehydrogenase subunit gamma [Cupriavidus sp. USMAHM13]AOZ07973.1 formate dehydrogenase subunit gamma [Cupriavidus malaysiensis]